MIKVVVLLRRPPAWTRERFHRWWLDEHVPYARNLPDLRKYRVCLVTGSTSYEGGRAALAHSRESHSDRLVLITEEHELIG